MRPQEVCADSTTDLDKFCVIHDLQDQHKVAISGWVCLFLWCRSGWRVWAGVLQSACQGVGGQPKVQSESWLERRRGRRESQEIKSGIEKGRKREMEPKALGWVKDVMKEVVNRRMEAEGLFSQYEQPHMLILSPVTSSLLSTVRPVTPRPPVTA